MCNTRQFATNHVALWIGKHSISKMNRNTGKHRAREKEKARKQAKEIKKIGEKK